MNLAIELPPELVVSTRLGFRDHVLRQVEGTNPAPEKVILDAHNCRQIDALGLGTLLLLRRAVERTGAKFVLVAPADLPVSAIVRVCHFQRLLHLESERRDTDD